MDHLPFPRSGDPWCGRGDQWSSEQVYLIQEYRVPSVDAAQISNIVAGCISVAPVVGAIVADAFFGCYPIVAVSMAISVLALVVFTLTASLHSLRPAPCQPGSGACEPATAGQMAALYAGVLLMCLTAAGSRFNQATMGSDQFESPGDREVLFNWFFVLLYGSSVIGSTVIVYVQGYTTANRARQPVHGAREGGRRRCQEEAG